VTGPTETQIKSAHLIVTHPKFSAELRDSLFASDLGGALIIDATNERRRKARERKRAERAHLADRGMSRVEVVVPTAKAAQIRELAEMLNETKPEDAK
jgi:hypothetical protein